MWQIYLNEDCDKPLTCVTFTDRHTHTHTHTHAHTHTPHTHTTHTHHTRFETCGVPASFQRNKMTEVYKVKVR